MKKFSYLCTRFSNIWLLMDARERLLKVIESYGMNGKQFAEEVGIGAGTLSNITGGRNNPSLEVMQRVLERFRNLNAQWLVLGTGPMYMSDPNASDGDGVSVPTEEAKVAQSTSAHASLGVPAAAPMVQKTIEKIVIFYTDGTFEER